MVEGKVNIPDWYQSSSEVERALVAEEARTSVGYLKQLAGKHRHPSRDLAKRIESATKQITPERVVTLMEALFPEDGKAA